MRDLFKGRLSRLNFGTGLILFYLMELLVALPLYVSFFIKNYGSNISGENFSNYMLQNFSLNTYTGVIFTLVWCVVVLWSLSIYVRRLNDIGKSSKWSLIVLFHFIYTRIMHYILATNINITDTAYVMLIITSLATVTDGAKNILAIIILLAKPDSNTNKHGLPVSTKLSFNKILFNK